MNDEPKLSRSDFLVKHTMRFRDELREHRAKCHWDGSSKNCKRCNQWRKDIEVIEYAMKSILIQLGVSQDGNQ